jgi:hypothetical protein
MNGIQGLHYDLISSLLDAIEQPGHSKAWNRPLPLSFPSPPLPLATQTLIPKGGGRVYK